MRIPIQPQQGNSDHVCMNGSIERESKSDITAVISLTANNHMIAFYLVTLRGTAG